MSILMVLSVAFSGCASTEGDSSEQSAQETTANEQVTATEALTTQAPTEETHENPVDSSWFDDAVFVGDSVSVMLNIYCDNNPEALGDAKFLCAGSLGYTNAQWEIDDPNNVHPSYRGETVLAENCAEVTGASKVLIMMGMNDIGVYGIDGGIESCDSLIKKIKKNSPNAQIYIQSVTPIMLGHEGDVLNNTNVQAFDQKLSEYCDANDCKYLDVYHALCDAYGYLPEEYCGDPEGQGIHFTSAACEVWIDYLKQNV